MKNLILILLLVSAARVVGGQGVVYVPCVYQNGYERDAAARVYRPKFEPVKGPPVVYKINAGAYVQFPLSMPAAGNCKGEFEAYDDRDDLAVAVTDNLGRYIRKQPAGDIEIMILNEWNFAAMVNNRNYAALYSSGRQVSGKFDVALPAGFFRLVISNKHSYLAPKSVTFRLGEKANNSHRR